MSQRSISPVWYEYQYQCLSMSHVQFMHVTMLPHIPHRLYTPQKMHWTYRSR